jgi:hypothetical protein
MTLDPRIKDKIAAYAASYQKHAMKCGGKASWISCPISDVETKASQVWEQLTAAGFSWEEIWSEVSPIIISLFAGSPVAQVVAAIIALLTPAINPTPVVPPAA